MTIHVLPVEDGPEVINPIADFSVFEDAPDTSIFIGNVFSDPDSDDDKIITSVVKITNDSLVTAKVVGDTLTLGFAPDENGSAEVTLRGTSGSQHIDDVFMFT